jgi:uncharacterized protein
MNKLKQLILAGLILVSSNALGSIAQSETLPTIVIPARSSNLQTQDPKYPLQTRIDRDIEQQLSKFFVFTKAAGSKIIQLRSILQPLADRRDPVALYWLAKTYDLYEFGVGNDRDTAIALKYYTTAADMGMATVEYFLSSVYQYRLMGVPKDERKVISYLDRAKLHGDNRVKVEVLLSYARLYSPTSDRTDFTFIPRDVRKMTDALQSAYAIEPDNPTVADWWGEELDKRKQYSVALSVYQRSSNPHTQQRVAQMYETGTGTAIDIPTALLWYKRSAKQQLSADNSGIPTYYRSGSMAHIYRLVCQQKIAPSAASPEFQQLEYDAYLQESINHQAALKLKTNPCIPIPGG